MLFYSRNFLNVFFPPFQNLELNISEIQTHFTLLEIIYLILVDYFACHI